MADGLESLSQPVVCVLSLLEPIVFLYLDISDLLEDISWKQYTAALVTLLLLFLILWTIFSESDYETIQVRPPEAAKVGWEGEELDELSIKVNSNHNLEKLQKILTRFYRNLV